MWITKVYGLTAHIVLGLAVPSVSFSQSLAYFHMWCCNVLEGGFSCFGCLDQVCPLMHSIAGKSSTWLVNICVDVSPWLVILPSSNKPRLEQLKRLNGTKLNRKYIFLAAIWKRRKKKLAIHSYKKSNIVQEVVPKHQLTEDFVWSM